MKPAENILGLHRPRIDVIVYELDVHCRGTDHRESNSRRREAIRIRFVRTVSIPGDRNASARDSVKERKERIPMLRRENQPLLRLVFCTHRVETVIDRIGLAISR